MTNDNERVFKRMDDNLEQLRKLLKIQEQGIEQCEKNMQTLSRTLESSCALCASLQIELARTRLKR